MSSVSSRWPGKARGQNTANLNDAMFSWRDGFEGERISHDHIAKRGRMFVTLRGNPEK